MSKLIGLIIAVVIVWGGWSLSNNKDQSELGPIKIGFIGPLTGDAAVYGEPIFNSVQMAVEEVNKAGGISGRPVEVIYENGKCEGPLSVTAVQKLISVDKVKYLIGGMCSSESLSIVPITKEAKVFQLTPGSSAPSLSGSSPYFFRNNPNDNQPAAILADYVSKNYKKVGVVSEKTDYAQGLKDVFIKEAENKGVAVSFEDFLTKEADFRSILTKIKSAEVDVIFINAQTPANAIKIAKQIKELGLKVAVVGAVFNDKDTLATGLFEGVVFAVNPTLPSEGKGGKFLSDYNTKYGKNPEYSYYAGASYDDVFLIKKAIEEVGDDTTKVSEFFRSMKSFDGVIGAYSFDQNGDMVGAGPVLEKIVGGKSVPLNQN